MGYYFLTADAEDAFWQVPIAEEAYMKPPKEWLKKMADCGAELPDRVVRKLNTERYGRRIAGQAFVEWAAGHLKEAEPSSALDVLQRSQWRVDGSAHG